MAKGEARARDGTTLSCVWATRRGMFCLDGTRKEIERLVEVGRGWKVGEGRSRQRVGARLV